MEGEKFVGMLFQVSEVGIHIREMEFPGAPSELVPVLTRAAHSLTGAEYFRSRVAAVAKFDLLPVFLQRGFLQATFAASETRVLPSSGDPSKSGSDLEVSVLVPVAPGKQYLVSKVEWNGNSVVGTNEAASLFHLPVGKPADAVRLQSDCETLTKLYHSRGYMTAKVAAEPRLDEAKASVLYAMNIQEGDQYRMGELEILGLDSLSTGRLREAWKLREGEPYNADYTNRFLTECVSLLPRGARYNVSLNEAIDAKEKLVDLTIHFKMQ
jgi:outer membrane protein assembly factor BamA